MGFLNYYLKKRIKIIITVLTIYAVFIISFILYRLPLSAVVYPFIICTMILVVSIICDAGKKYRKFKNIKLLLENEDISMSDIEDMINDYEYEDLFRELISQKEQIKASDSENFNSMVDYYTLWAHQIKTPIASMRLNLQNTESPLSHQLRSDLFRIEQYVEMVLTYLRLDSSSTDYVFREYDLDSIIKSTVKKFAGDFIAKKITLNYEPLNKKVLTDEKWLSFVIEQIITNSLKYTDKGSITVCIEDDFLCIKDTGIGISQEDLPRIFDRGFTGMNGRTQNKSSGIGLYLVGRICKNLNHPVTVESDIGKGTTVKINLRRDINNFE